MFAILTGLLIAVVVWPLVRPGSGAATDDGGEGLDIAIFRDQLLELDSDLERGLIGPAEAGAARNEISRRLLSVRSIGATLKSGASRPEWGMAAAVALVVLLVAVPAYLRSGAPEMPDVPYADRLANAEQAKDVPAMIAKVEQVVRTTRKDDVQGWQLLTNYYMDTQHYEEASDAIWNLLRIGPKTADLWTAYAAALTLARKEVPPPEAIKALDEALALDPKNIRARLMQADFLRKDGKEDEARAAFTALLKDAPADAPWRAMVVQALDRGPDATQVAAAQSMAPQDRQAMIRSMVAGLQARLGTQGGTVEEWIKLIRAQTVLGEPDNARASLIQAKVALKNDKPALDQLATLAGQLGISP